MGRVDSESMLYAGFEIDDPFLVDKSITAQHRDIVLALIDEREITLKRLMMTAKMSKQEIKEMFGDEDYELPLFGWELKIQLTSILFLKTASLSLSKGLWLSTSSNFIDARPANKKYKNESWKSYIRVSGRE